MAIVRYTAEEMEKLSSATDWERLRNMRDEDIDTSDPDAPELTELLQHANKVVKKTVVLRSNTG